MSDKQIIDHLQTILTDELDMEGRPTLEKCKEIRKRREFEAEMREIDTSNIISEPRRRSSTKAAILVESSDSEDESEASSNESSQSSESSQSDNESSEEIITKRPKPVNWSALGDPETDSE